MFEKPFEVIKLETHIDKRGSLNEILRFKDQNIPGEGQLYVFSINPGERRGDHYHKNKHEWFSCVSGEAVILVEDKDGNKKRVVLNAKKPSVLYNAPRVAHALLNETDKEAIVVSYGSTQHDPDNPDTYQRVIE